MQCIMGHRIAKKLKPKRLFVALSLFSFALLISRIYVSPVPERSEVQDYHLPVCEEEHPCSYPDAVVLRIIVLTLNRPRSLSLLFESLDELELDNHSAAVEIWIDRNRKTNEVDEETVKVASQFRWRGGPTRVHVHQTHVGIHGQWINTWRPPDDSINELALIAEDDMSVSKYAYRWMLAVFRAYNHRKDFAGASLTSYQMFMLSLSRAKGPMAGPKNHTVFMYKCFWWGVFAPQPMHWRRFQDWYHKHKPSVMPNFRPYVPGTIPSRAYRNYERRGIAWTMWTMWYIYYMYENHLYSLHSNLRVYTGQKESSLSVNRNEVGLHFRHKGRADISRLLNVWKDEYILFPQETVKLDWDGSHIK